MNTYFVEINAHFLTKIEYDGSAAGAEHYFLDNFRKSVWGANAYDEKGMKTECFRGALLTSELISKEALENLLNETERRMDELKGYQEKMAKLEAEYAELERKKEEIRKERAEIIEEMGYPERKCREYIEKSHCTRPY